MEILVAIGHIVGAIVASVIMTYLLILFTEWVGERSKKHTLDEISVALGVPVTDLDTPEMEQRVTQIAAERFSSELLRNRLSDLCGSLQTVWNYLGLAAQVLWIGAVIWFVFTDGHANAKFAWWLMAGVLFFWAVDFAFTLLCKLLTGRFPGQAKQSRKRMADAARAKFATQHPDVEIDDD